MAKEAKQERVYRADIDGIRALAILSVVLYHANVPLLSGGFTGVDIFFVLSGYLIGGHIFSELQTDRFSYLRFYQRRAKRILPAFYTVLVFVLVAIVALLSPLNAYHAARSAFFATLSGSNFEFWRGTGYFDAGSESNPLLMTWSLAVEEQFYVVIPLLMVLLAKVRRNWVLPSILVVCAASFGFAVAMLGNYPSLVFYLLPARAWELGVGVVLAVIELSKGRYTKSGPFAEGISAIGLAGIVLPFFLLTKTTPFPGAAALPSVLGTALILAVPQSWINRRLLSLSPLVYVGRVSYSWYLWHWPVLTFLRNLYDQSGPPLVVVLGAMGLAFGAAVVSYYVIEQPFRQSKRAAGPLLLRYGAVTVVFLAACGFIAKSHGFPERYPRLSAMEAKTLSRGTDPCLVDDGEDQPNLAPQCYRPLGTQPSVALWGDSHSGAIAPGMRTVAIESGYGFDQLGKLGCLPLIGAVRFTPTLPKESEECVRFNEKTLAVLKADPQIRIVVLAGFWANPFRARHPDNVDTWLTPDLAHEREKPTLEASKQLLERSLTATIQQLQAAGKQVMVLGDTPSFAFNPIVQIGAAAIPAQRALDGWFHLPVAEDPGTAAPGYPESDAVAAGALREALGLLPGVTLIDLTPKLCSSPSVCLYRNGDVLLYVDDHHMTAEGAAYALRDFKFPAGGRVEK